LVMMRHVAGLSPEEIALVSRTSRTAVYAALERAEKRLRALLGEPRTQ
jgi:DNA-directed RNA polymerase specialized sigma24 family protein